MSDVSDVGDLTCREMVQLVTDYLEDRMPAAERVRFEEHLMGCEGCEIYLDQVKTTIRITGTLEEDSIPAQQLEALTRAFRSWKQGLRR